MSIWRRAPEASSPASQTGDTSVRWQSVKDIVLAALDLPEESRSDFVSRRCAGDAGLECEVRSLLSNEREAREMWETPAAEVLFVAARDTSQTPKAHFLEPGTLLTHYEISSFVAAGGMGEVYVAHDVRDGRKVALKVVKGERANPVEYRRLIREAHHASLLSHPGICAIYEIGDSDGVPFIAMQYIDGAPLDKVIRERKPGWDSQLDIAVQVAAAVSHAHERGVVHRDLKTSNVMVGGTGMAVVLDFGLARRIPGVGAEASTVERTVTSAGAIAGTPACMAPEILRGQRADARSDVWSLGLILYELVTGERPFARSTNFETTCAVLYGEARPIDAGIPPALRLVIERCLMKSPAARYATAAGVHEALERMRNGYRRKGLPRMIVEKLRAWTGRHAAFLLLLVAAGLEGSVMAMEGRQNEAGFHSILGDRTGYVPPAS